MWTIQLPVFPSHFVRLLAGLLKLRARVAVIIFLAGFIFPAWLTAFAAQEDGGFHLLWSFMVFDIFFGSSRCIDDHETWAANYCETEYRLFATSTSVQTPALLIVANLCLVFLCQLGWHRTSSLHELLTSINGSDQHRRAAAMFVWLNGSLFFLPLIPVTSLMAGIVNMGELHNATSPVMITGARKMWVSIGMPSLGLAVPAFCGLLMLQLRDRRSLNLFHLLHDRRSDISASSNSKVQGTSESDKPLVSHAEATERFIGKPLIVGQPAATSRGIWKFIQQDENSMHLKIASSGVNCVVDEWNEAFEQNKGVKRDDLDQLDYVLNQHAGSNDDKFQNGWQRDRDPKNKASDGNFKVAADRVRSDGKGMLLDDFVNSDQAVRAGLTLSHVLALRLYTTSAFQRINGPLRELAARSSSADVRLDKPHPLPCTVYLIYDGLKKLREPPTVASPTVASPTVTSPSPESPDQRTPSSRPAAMSEVGAAIFPGGYTRSDDAIEVEETTPADVPPHASFELESSSLKNPRPSLAMSARAQRRWDLFRRRIITRSSKASPPLLSLKTPPNSAAEQSSPQPLCAFQPKVLLRGMGNMRATHNFLKEGGSELAPCSSTSDLDIAIRYAKKWQDDDGHDGQAALIFRIIVDGWLDQAPDLSFLSAFPHEKEFTYPPLTFFQPVGKMERLIYNGTEFTILDAKPSFPT